jgi:DNA-binding beta-propeller fold protein YncE
VRSQSIRRIALLIVAAVFASVAAMSASAAAFAGSPPDFEGHIAAEGLLLDRSPFQTSAIEGSVGVSRSSAARRKTLLQAQADIAPYSKHPSELRPYAVCPPPTKTHPSCGILGGPNRQKLRSRELAVPKYEGSGEKGGFSPADLRDAYNLPSKGGKGITVAITVAFDYPKAESDLAVYRETYGLPACTSANGCFTKVNQKGEAKNYPEADLEWAREAALDLDMVSAACPECDIALVEADSDFFEDMDLVVETAAELGADVISNSWGASESAEETSHDKYFNHPGIPVLFSSGDSGYGVEYPTSSPYVVSTGGTRLQKAENARGWSESAWGGAGSGCSSYEKKPAWQKDTGCANRTVSDVSAVSDPETPVSTYDSEWTGWSTVGGTSVAAPLIAGIEALSSASVRAAGPAAFPYLGQGGELFDVTAGQNGACETYLCNARSGYDGPTGWGAPDGPMEMPVAVTEEPTINSSSKATLRGSLNPGGLETKYRFEYGTTTFYATSVPVPDANAGSGSEYAQVSQAIEGLKAGTAYHYRITATNSKGTFSGLDRTFGTAAPTATTNAASNVSAHNAILNADVDPAGSATNYYFEYGATTSYGAKIPLGEGKELGAGTSSIAVSAAINGLISGTTYHFRIIATNPVGKATGEDKTFTTSTAEWDARELPEPKQTPPYGGWKAVRGASDVSCAKPNSCVAVGAYWNLEVFTRVPLAELWDGNSWSVMPTPYPEGLYEGWKYNPRREATLTGVTCTATDSCLAVGWYRISSGVKPLAMGWNGSKWTTISVPEPSEATGATLTEISCSSSAQCTAIGEYQNKVGAVKPLVERWNGSEWVVQQVAESAEASSIALRGISCFSGTQCTAVGFFQNGSGKYKTLAETWDGSKWTLQTTAEPAEASLAVLADVSCTSSTHCTAVGVYLKGTLPYSTTLAENWNGSKWTVQSTPNKGYETSLGGVSCTTASSCTAVGDYEETGGGLQPMPILERWNGSKWSILTIAELPIPEGWWQETRLGSVSCVYNTDCAAVGTSISAPEGSLGTETAWAEQSVVKLAKATTGAASGVKGTKATLNGTVNPEGTGTGYYVEYGLTASYGTKVPLTAKDAGFGTSDVAVSEAVSGLSPNTIYNFRVVAETTAGTTKGENKTFTTLKVPKATTEAASGVKTKEATINGTVNPQGTSTTYYFEYGATKSYGTKAPTTPKEVGSGTSDIAVSQSATALFPGTTYHYRILAENANGDVVSGEDETFKTLGVPTATTEAATNITSDNVTLNGTVNPRGLSTAYRFEYGKTTAYGTSVPAPDKAIGSGTSDVKVSEAIGGLKQSTAYHFRVVASNAEGTSYGEDEMLITKPAPQFSFAFGSEGSGNGQLAYPYGLAVDSTGNLWVADSQNNRIEKFNSKGEYLSQFGTFGSGNGQLNNPLGLAIDSSGNLWVTDSGNNRIEKFNSKGEYLSKFGTTGSGNGQFREPSGLAIDSAGNLWVVDAQNSRVQKLNSKGEYLSQFGTSGAGNGQFLWPFDVAIDSAGDLWVTDAGNSRVEKFNSKGEYLSQFGEPGTGDGQLIEPAGIAIDSEGDLWVTDAGNSRVEKWTPSRPAVTTESAGALTSETATLNATLNPKGLSTAYRFEYGKTTAYGTSVPVPDKAIGSGSSDVKVSEAIGGLKQGTAYHFRVVASNAEGTSYGQDVAFTTVGPAFSFAFGSEGSGNGQLAYPYGLAVDSTGNLWVADSQNNRIEKFNSKGEYLSQFGTFGSGNGQLNNPLGLAIDSSGNLWVTDSGNNRIEKFNSKGEYLSKFGTTGSGNGQFREPSGLAIDSAGNLWVVDAQNSRVQKLNSKGEYLSQFGTSGAGNGQFLWPFDVAIDSAGDLWVTDAGNSRVEKFNSKGEYLSQFGEPGTGDGQLIEPAGIAIDSEGDLWVTDAGNSRVEKWTP